MKIRNLIEVLLHYDQDYVVDEATIKLSIEDERKASIEYKDDNLQYQEDFI